MLSIRRFIAKFGHAGKHVCTYCLSWSLWIFGARTRMVCIQHRKQLVLYTFDRISTAHLFIWTFVLCLSIKSLNKGKFIIKTTFAIFPHQNKQFILRYTRWCQPAYRTDMLSYFFYLRWVIVKTYPTLCRSRNALMALTICTLEPNLNYSRININRITAYSKG